jgi:hypothetical protein
MRKIFFTLILSIITYFGITSISYSNQSLEIETFIFDECTYWHKEDFQRCYDEKKKLAAANPSKFLADEKNKQNAITKEAAEKKTKPDDSKFARKCEGGIFSKGHKRGTQEFEDCVKMETGLAIVADFEKQQEKEKRNMKTTLKQDQKQRTVNDQQVSNSDNNREEQIKISKMKPEDRYAYTCNEKFGFRKGSDKFKDCIFELYKAETELEKLELQKQVAKANADAARANAEAARAGAERQERLALAQTEAAKMQSLAARQQAIAANTADSLALIESGLRMMSPQRPAVAPMRTCTYNRNFMNCF